MNRLKFAVTSHGGLNPRMWQNTGMICG